jgi:hypothetical protein
MASMEKMLIQRPEHELSRRDVHGILLGLTAAVGLGSILSSDERRRLYEADIREMLDVAKPLPIPKANVEEKLPQHEQMIVSSNPKLEALGRTAVKKAHVVVHPGYITTQIGDMMKEYGNLRVPYEASIPEASRSYDTESKDWESDDRWDIDNFTDLLGGSEGDYIAYRKNLAQYFRSLAQTDDPVIVFAEERAAYTGNLQYPELAIPDNSFVVVTEEADPTPVEAVRYRHANTTVVGHQTLELLYERLKKSGIQEIHFAGELGLSRGGGVWAACLGGVVMDFQKRGFEAHGVQGAVFPSKPVDLPPKGKPMPTTGADRVDPESAAMARALHYDTVPLPRS